MNHVWQRFFKVLKNHIFFHILALAGDDDQSTRTIGFDEVEDKQLVERSSGGGRRQRKTVVSRQEETHLQEVQEGVVMNKEEVEEVKFGCSKMMEKIIAKERNEETLRQDSYENYTMESKSKPEENVKEGVDMVKSHQPLLLHRAPRYTFTILTC